MKLILVITFFILAYTDCFSQTTGPGILYTYVAGFRTRREYKTNTPLLKTGKNDSGATADTVVILSKDSWSSSGKDVKEYVKAYPNPTYNNIYIENYHLGVGEIATIKLFDVTGKQILTQTTLSSKEIVRLGNVATGPYQVNYYVNNLLIATWKIIKL